VRMIKCLGAAICPALLALTGCPSPKPAATAPPIMQTAYVDYQGTIQWLPTGTPFEIYWTGINPCDTAHVGSDGTTVATCHVLNAGMYGGSYPYYVGKPGQSGIDSSKTNGVIYMHVGSCSSCPTTPAIETTPQTKMKGQVSPPPVQVSADPVNPNQVQISCPSPGGASTSTKVDPSTGPSGLKKGDTVTFQFSGNNPPPGKQPLTLTFQPNYCSGLSAPYKIMGLSGSCQVPSSTAPTTTYTAQSADCASTTASLPAIP
jgi:hypothetical protein